MCEFLEGSKGDSDEVSSWNSMCPCFRGISQEFKFIKEVIEENSSKKLKNENRRDLNV